MVRSSDYMELDYSIFNKKHKFPIYRDTLTLPKKTVSRANNVEEVFSLTKDIFGRTQVRYGTAQPEDRIIKFGENNRVVIPNNEFILRFEGDPHDNKHYRSRLHGPATQVEYDFFISPNDEYEGEDIIKIHKGGYVLQCCYKSYFHAFERIVFESDFARQALDGSMIKLSESLSAQRLWAQKHNERLHLQDIIRLESLVKKQKNNNYNRFPAP